MNSYLSERERAKRALDRENQRYLLTIGRPVMTAQDLHIRYWTQVLATDCPNKAQEERNLRVHRLENRLNQIKHEFDWIECIRLSIAETPQRRDLPQYKSKKEAA